MYNSGNSSKNVTGASVVDGTLYTVDIADDAVTADKLANSVNTDIATGVSGSTTAGDALPKAGGAMTGAITTNSTFDGVDVATRDAVLTSTTNTADAALPKAGGTMTGNITNLSTLGDMNLKATGGTSGAEVHRLEWHNNQYQIASLRAVVGAGQINRGELHFYTENGGGQGLALKIDPWRNVTVTNGIRIGTAGAGIDFSGVGTAAEILDDYEEGTFTPTPNAGSFGSTDSYYTKIGNMVTIWSTINDIDSNGSAAWNFEISGLPFNISDSPAGGSVMSNGVTLTSANAVSLNAANATTLRIYKSISGSAWSPLKHSDFNADNANDLKINFTYRAA
jgi:hypothetical protein